MVDGNSLISHVREFHPWSVFPPSWMFLIRFVWNRVRKWSINRGFDREKSIRDLMEDRGPLLCFGSLCSSLNTPFFHMVSGLLFVFLNLKRFTESTRETIFFKCFYETLVFSCAIEFGIDHILRGASNEYILQMKYTFTFEKWGKRHMSREHHTGFGNCRMRASFHAKSTKTWVAWKLSKHFLARLSVFPILRSTRFFHQLVQ